MVLKTTYDEYRTTTYDPAPPRLPLANKLTTSEDEVFLSWKKNIKISMDYKPSRTKPAGLVSAERFITTIEFHGLDHLIDINYVVAVNLDSIRSNVDGLQDLQDHSSPLKGIIESFQRVVENLGRNVRTL
jgi:hypothetical protein